MIHRLFRAVVATVLLLASFFASAACTTTGACVSAGPRLASVDSTKSALLNPLLGGLLGTNLNLTAADWNTLATGEVNLLGFLTALQAQTNVSSPSQALTANATLGQIVAALGVQAQAQANTSLTSVLYGLQPQLGSAGATVRVGDLLQLTADATTLSKTTINSLDMLTGLIQLYNRRNVLTTPTAVGISGGALGMLGILNSVQLYAQVIEPAVYICGPTGSRFHSAAVRIKLKLDLVTLAPVTDALVIPPLITKASLGIAQMDVYVEVARGEGTIGTIDAVNRAVTLQALPGIADVYIGKIPDSVFFNRSRTLSAADVDYGNIGSLMINDLVVAIEVKAAVRGQAPFSSTVTMSGTFPQTRTVSTSAAFVTNTVNSLVTNLELRLTPKLSPVTGVLDNLVMPLLKPLVTTTLTPVLTPVLTGVADPLLQLLGIGLGQVVVTVNGICEACDEFKLQKSADKANATPGSTIVYTITYQNSGTTTINNLKIADATPAYTVFGAGGCGTLASGLSACSVSSKPAAGAAGPVEWTFTGTLLPGATGTVTLNVVVQ